MRYVSSFLLLIQCMYTRDETVALETTLSLIFLILVPVAYLTGYSILRRVEFTDKKTTAVTFLALLLTVAVNSFVVVGIAFFDPFISILVDIPPSALNGLVASFAYRNPKRLEVAVFWVAVTLILDIAALPLYPVVDRICCCGW